MTNHEKKDRRQLQSQSPWLALPPPIRRIFDLFPLVKYDRANLPSAQTKSRPTLYSFTTPEDARRGLPSFNPACLRWQGSSNHAAPNGRLPFLISADETISSQDLASWIKRDRRARDPAPNVDDRRTCYRALIEYRVRAAYVGLFCRFPELMQLFILYLIPENFAHFVRSRYIDSASTNPLVRAYSASQLQRTAQQELEKLVPMVEADSILREAHKALVDLATFLGDSDHFSGAARPGDLDALLFSYLHILLDESLISARSALDIPPALLQHHQRILGLFLV